MIRTLYPRWKNPRYPLVSLRVGPDAAVRIKIAAARSPSQWWVSYLLYWLIASAHGTLGGLQFVQPTEGTWAGAFFSLHRPPRVQRYRSQAVGAASWHQRELRVEVKNTRSVHPLPQNFYVKVQWHMGEFVFFFTHNWITWAPYSALLNNLWNSHVSYSAFGFFA
jgi:hypothetical protein